MFLCCVLVTTEYITVLLCFFFFQAEDGIRDLVRSRGLGDVYKRQAAISTASEIAMPSEPGESGCAARMARPAAVNSDAVSYTHLTLADERSSVDLGGRRIIKKKKKKEISQVEQLSLIH